MTAQIEDNQVIFKLKNGEELALTSELSPRVVEALRFTILSVVRNVKVIADGTQEIHSIPPWLLSLTACIKSSEPSISKCSVEGLIYIISSDRTESIYLKMRELVQGQAGNDAFTQPPISKFPSLAPSRLPTSQR